MWRYLAPRLKTMQVLTKLDRPALARYCQVWSRWVKAEKFLLQFGETYPYKDDRGQVRLFMPWPQAAIAARLSQQLLKLEQEFGLTPSARTSLNTAACGVGGRGGYVGVHPARGWPGRAGVPATAQPLTRLQAFVAEGGVQPRSRFAEFAARGGIHPRKSLSESASCGGPEPQSRG